MRIVITGASGFLGGQLVKLLSSENADYVGVSRTNQPGLMQVSDYKDTPTGDVLIHLAEINDRAHANKLGVVYEEEANELLECLIEKGYRKIIYASSSVLYGDTNTSPCKVSDPVYVVDSYTRIKRKSEEAVLESGGVVARLSNLYGPGMSDKNVLSAMLGQLGEDGPMYLYNTSPIRDFLWVDDAADALVKMTHCEHSEIYNIGSGVGISIAELAHQVVVAAEQSTREVMSTINDATASSLVLDISSTKAALGWQPNVDIKQGVRNLVNDIKLEKDE